MTVNSYPSEVRHCHSQPRCMSVTTRGRRQPVTISNFPTMVRSPRCLWSPPTDTGPETASRTPKLSHGCGLPLSENLTASFQLSHALRLCRTRAFPRSDFVSATQQGVRDSVSQIHTFPRLPVLGLMIHSSGVIKKVSVRGQLCSVPTLPILLAKTLQLINISCTFDVSCNSCMFNLTTV